MLVSWGRKNLALTAFSATQCFSPAGVSGSLWALHRENGDIEKYEQIRQFFYYHETNGNSMTHCSLRGSTDTFTDTGKWFFPDPWMSMLGDVKKLVILEMSMTFACMP